MPTQEIEQYWTTKEIADRAKVSDNSVRRWLMDGKLLFKKIGGRTRIAESDFQKFIQNGKPQQSNAA